VVFHAPSATHPVQPVQPQFQAQPDLTELQLPIRSISNGGASGDHMCYQQAQFSAAAPSIIGAEVVAHAKYATYDAPYDLDAGGYAGCVPGPLSPLLYEELWVNDIHSAGLHAWFRQFWNNWISWYGQTKLTYATTPQVPYETLRGVDAVLDGSDHASYLAKTFYFILQHPGLFADGDIFTPQSEPQNGGIGCHSCQFPNVSEYNRFLRDSMTLDRYAFYKLGRKVFVGMWGVSCTDLIVDDATVIQMGILSTDCYARSPDQMQTALASMYTRYGTRLAIGEWGDIWDAAAQPRMNKEIDNVLAKLTATPYVVGINYWQAIGGSGGEGLVDPSRLVLNAAGSELAIWYGAWPTSFVASHDASWLSAAHTLLTGP